MEKTVLTETHGWSRRQHISGINQTPDGNPPRRLAIYGDEEDIQRGGAGQLSRYTDDRREI